ncbi:MULTISPECIES: hypothetical protein [Pseudomonas]|nr:MULTISPECIES: hypothetical protein [Pseudomonas]MCE4073518.1 hypothetical protein [Pseudomonas nitritireducens]MCE4079757.1 hypothetical protein [Pseudomonas nitroreducens]
MITAPAQTPTHEDRLRALEERLLEMVEDLHHLREDMSAQPPAEGEE